MRHFDIPENYRSPLIQILKNKREQSDPLKKDFSPTVIDFGVIKIILPRHFGLCFGVANAIEIAFKAVAENPNKKIYLLSEMIHNPFVNKQLQDKGIQFLMDTKGNQLIKFSLLTKEDIVLIPAFGITLEMEKTLHDIGVTLYNTTCPFVERVWKRAKNIAEKNYTIIIHGKVNHEETKSTFSHAQKYAPCLIVKNIAQTEILKKYILGKKEMQHFEQDFKGQYSSNFNPYTCLERLAVINQTTMLATETKQIATILKATMIRKYDIENDVAENYFADTRDTLCYATNDNQQALINVFEQNPDMALVVGGHNSSNTSHLVELCEEHLPTFFITSAEDIVSPSTIQHYDLKQQEFKIQNNFLPQSFSDIKIMIASGASCPDAITENVIKKMVSLYPNAYPYEAVLETLMNS